MAFDLDELLIALKWHEEGANIPAGARAKLQNLIQAQQALTQTTAAGVTPLQAAIPAIAGAGAAAGAAAPRVEDLGNAVGRTSRQFVGAGRSVGLMRGALSMYAFQAVGATGVTGRLATGLLMFGTGGAVTLTAVGGLALIGGAFKFATAEATKLREQSERLNVTWRTLRAEGKPIIALRDELNKALKEQATAQRELDIVSGKPGIGFTLRAKGTPGEIALAETALQDAKRVVEERRRLFAQGGAEAGEAWVARFMDTLKDLSLDAQLARLTANEAEFAMRGTEAARAWQRAFQDLITKMPAIRPTLRGALQAAVDLRGGALVPRIAEPGGAAVGTGAVFNRAFEDFQQIQLRGGVILRSLIPPQQQFNDAMAILNQTVAFGALSADERADAERRLAEAMGVTTKRSAILGVAIIGAVSGAIAAVIQGGTPGSIIGGLLGTAGGVVGIGNPLLGAGIAGLGTIVSALGSNADRNADKIVRAIDRMAQEVGLERVTVVFTGPDGHQVRKTLAELESGDAVERVPGPVGASG